MNKKLIVGSFILLALLLTRCGFSSSPSSPHLLLGNPSDAGEDPNNYLMIKPQYALSYNQERGTPNWVSWQLNSKWLGDAERQDDFRSDPSLPEGWEKVTTSDYTNSGYDRGHMAPSADRTANVEDNSATFLMTNIVPQTAKNNRGVWKDLEEYCRDLVEEGKELYITAGVYGQQKKFGDDPKITAPSSVWKVIVVMDKPVRSLRAVSKDTQVIAVDIGNRSNLSSDWRKYRVSVDQIETKTGYNLLNLVPKSIQEAIESRVD